MKRAVCLVSGGMDSYVAARIAQEAGYGLFLLTFNYSQKNARETECANKISEKLGAKEHRIIRLDLSWMPSSLTSEDMEIPRRQDPGIPSTYVPARNTIFISIALGYAEALNACAIYTGVNAVDFSGYPDCRPEYLERFQRLIDVATRETLSGGRIKLEAPLLNLSKSGIIEKGASLGVDFSCTWSCYVGGERPCGDCASCRLRSAGFRDAGIADPCSGQDWK